jgi:hypothetical protein
VFDLTPFQARETDYGHLLSAVERHLCQTYCLRNKCCLFHYGFDHSDLTFVSIQEKDSEGGSRYIIDLNSKRNDAWLNSHCRSVMECWRANVDFRLTLDLGKIIDYMTKYVTKAESPMSSSAASLVRSILESTIHAGGEVQTALKRTMGKLIGERTISKQECSHLILSLPMVYCSHQFVTINLKNEMNRIDLSDDAVAGAKSRPATRTVVDVYGTRMDEDTWVSAAVLKNAKKLLGVDLDSVTLQDFAFVCRVGARGPSRNKIGLHQTGKSNKAMVPMFTPKLSCDPESAVYPEYCRLALVRYKPWVGKSQSVAYGGPDASDEEVVAAWTAFLEASDVDTSPDGLHRQIRKHRAQKRRDNTGSGGDNAEGGDLELNDGDDNDDDMSTDYVDIFEQAVMRGGEQRDDLEDDFGITWSRNEDWSKCRQDYSEGNKVVETGADKTLKEFLTEQIVPLNAKQVKFENLNAKQKIAFLMAQRARGADATPEQKRMLLLGKGGTGKSHTIYSILTDMEEKKEKYLVMATTGKAATVIGGSTVHSVKDGLGIPIDPKAFQVLEGATLKNLQIRLKDLKPIVIDEFSMLK